MKKVQRELDLRLKSQPDAKSAMIGALIVYCVLLRDEVREMVLFAGQPGQNQLGRVNNVFVLASMIQPLLKEADAHQIGELEDALRRLH